MAQRASFALLFVLFLSPRFCLGQQPAPGSTAAMRGLRGAVQSVSTKGFKCRDNGQEIPTTSERSVYDRSGYEMDDAIILGSGTKQLSPTCNISIPSGDDVSEIHVQWLKS
jgi:hypothetical protein